MNHFGDRFCDEKFAFRVRVRVRKRVREWTFEWKRVWVSVCGQRARTSEKENLIPSQIFDRITIGFWLQTSGSKLPTRKFRVLNFWAPTSQSNRKIRRQLWSRPSKNFEIVSSWLSSSNVSYLPNSVRYQHENFTRSSNQALCSISSIKIVDQTPDLPVDKHSAY